MIELRERISDAVSRAVAKAERDGPVGICLSGGIDSSTVAAFAPELPLFTGYYQGELFDERPWARLVGEGRDWRTIEIRPADFVRVFDAVREVLGGLECGPGAVGQYVVAEVAAEAGIRTLLTGEGGDELFGGYARQHLAAGIPPPDGYDDYKLPEGYPETLRGALELEWDALRTLCAVDEAIAGAHGIRVVPPILDPWVVAHVFQQPSGHRIGKGLLKAAMRGVVPDAILDRIDKRGFPAPFVAWAQDDPVRGFVEARIGYVPDAEKPWDRGWWLDLLDPEPAETLAA